MGTIIRTFEIPITKIGENIISDFVLPAGAKAIKRIAVCISPEIPTITDIGYFGVAAAPNIPLANAYIDTNLARQVILGNTSSFSVTANAGEFVYYALPTRLGVRYFRYGVITGGFSLENTIPITDILTGITENYYIYKSNNANLGTLTVQVSDTI